MKIKTVFYFSLLGALVVAFSEDVKAEYCRDSAEMDVEGMPVIFTECFTDPNNLTNPISRSYRLTDGVSFEQKIEDTFDEQGRVMSENQYIKYLGEYAEYGQATANYQYAYDANNRVSTVIETDFGGEYTKSIFTYQDNGNVEENRYDSDGNFTYGTIYTTDKELAGEYLPQDFIENNEYYSMDFRIDENGERKYNGGSASDSPHVFGRTNYNEVASYLSEENINIAYGDLYAVGDANTENKNNQDVKRIYTVEEATAAAKGNKNTFILKYR